MKIFKKSKREELKENIAVTMIVISYVVGVYVITYEVFKFTFLVVCKVCDKTKTLISKKKEQNVMGEM